jgi:cytoskeletal protein RodZ
MLTAGEQLRQRRLELKLTFTQLGMMTKIPVDLLRALEKNRFEVLPDLPFLKGMVRNYALSLNLDPVKIGAALRRDYRQAKTRPLAVPQPLDRKPLSRWLEQPITLYLAGILLFVGLVGWFLWRAYQPPRLVIERPKDGQTAVSPVAIKGKTDREAAISVNGKVINLNPDGSFETNWTAAEGEQRLVFRAVSRRQKLNEKTITVIIIK